MEKTYFYLLIGLVWIISNLYKSFRKKEAEKKSSQDDNASSDKPSKKIETILEEILTGTAQPVEESTPQPIFVKPPKKKRKAKPAYSQELITDERTEETKTNNIFSYETAIADVGQNKTDVQENMPDEVEDSKIIVNWRDAIIYSEIMGKPKYQEES